MLEAASAGAAAGSGGSGDTDHDAAARAMQVLEDSRLHLRCTAATMRGLAVHGSCRRRARAGPVMQPCWCCDCCAFAGSSRCNDASARKASFCGCTCSMRSRRRSPPGPLSGPQCLRCGPLLHPPCTFEWLSTPATHEGFCLLGHCRQPEPGLTLRCPWAVNSDSLRLSPLAVIGRRRGRQSDALRCLAAAWRLMTGALTATACSDSVNRPQASGSPRVSLSWAASPTESASLQLQVSGSLSFS